MVCVCASRVFSQRRFFCRVHCQFVIVCVSMLCRLQLYPNPENQVESCAFCFAFWVPLLESRGEFLKVGRTDEMAVLMILETG